MKDKNLLERPTKEPAGAPKPVIIQKLEVRPYNRTEQNIPNWRRAVQSAESQIPRRVLLYSLYADVDLDGHVEAVTGKRRDAVTGANWQFVDKNGEPINEINQLIDTIGFGDLLEEIVNTRFWGYTIVEPKFWKNDEGEWEMEPNLIPRLNYRPEIGKVAYDLYSDDGINIREGIYAKTVMEVGKVKDLGLYMKAAPYQILKRGGLGDYAAFIQTFGTPIFDAQWDGFDEKQKAELQAALNDIGAGGSIIRPEGTNLEIKENNAKDTGDSHGNFLKFLNAEISKAILGTTETTESSSSSGYAQSKTHQEQDDAKHENDTTYVRRVLNSRFITVMKAAGLNTKGGKFIIQGEDTELTKKESFDIYKGMHDMGVPIDDDFWYDNFNVPKPKNYDQLKAEKQQYKDAINQLGDPVEKPKPNKKKPAKEDHTDEKDVTLSERIKTLFNSVFQFAPAENVGATTGCCGEVHTITLSQDQRFNDDMLIQRIWEAKGKAHFDARLWWHTSDLLINGFKKGWQKGNTVNLAEAPGFTYGSEDPFMLWAFEQNLFRFSASKTFAQLQELNQLFKEAKSFEEFYQQAKAKTDIFNKAWLETEYNTALLTGEAASTYYRLLAQAQIFPYWEYKTVGDALVRPEHAALHGLILPANDPRWKLIFPPNGWNCRCYIVPRMIHEVDTSKNKAMRARADAYINSPQFQKEKGQGFGINRALSKEVFTENQMYARKFPGLSKIYIKRNGELINELTYKNYELDAYARAKQVAAIDTPLYSGTANDYFDNLESLNDVKIVRDYHNRPLKVLKANFDTHTTNQDKKRAFRSGMLTAMENSLQVPDEVWMNGKNQQEVLYVKYYKDQTIISRGIFNNGVVELISWFNLAEKREDIDKIRKGLLIYKK